MKMETTVSKCKFEINLNHPEYKVSPAEMAFLLRNASYRMLPFFESAATKAREEKKVEPFQVFSDDMLDAIKELVQKDEKKNAAAVLAEKLARFEALVASGVLLPSGLPNPEYVAPEIEESEEETETES